MKVISLYCESKALLYSKSPFVHLIDIYWAVANPVDQEVNILHVAKHSATLDFYGVPPQETL